MPKLWFSNKQRPIIIVNNRAIRYEHVSMMRPLTERVYSVFDAPSAYREYDPLPWLECDILDTSGEHHKFVVRNEHWPREHEQRRSGRQVIRLKTGT